MRWLSSHRSLVDKYRMKIEIRPEPYNPYQELESYETARLQQGQFGAQASFIGSMRDSNEGDKVLSMTLEHYPEMTEKHLKSIAQEACVQWQLLDVLILHRVGKIQIGDSIVLVAAWSEHRLDAFEACRFIMEDLKSKAPFWKKEQLEQGERWVEKNTAGYSE